MFRPLPLLQQLSFASLAVVCVSCGGGDAGTTGPSGPSTPSLTITTTSLPQASIGSGYAQAVAASGGVPPYAWSAGAGLPNGMGINASTGAIFGTPQSSGTFNFTVTVVDADSPQQRSSKTLSLTVGPYDVASVSVSPLTSLVPVSGVRQLTATVLDTRGASISAPVTWSSSDNSKVSVASTGSITALAVGTSVITAAAGSKSATATITVVAAGILGVALNGELFEVPTTANSADVKLSNIRLPDVGPSLEVPDIAITSDGALFGIGRLYGLFSSTTSLYSLNRVTGSAGFPGVGSSFDVSEEENVNGLAANAAGVLYASTGSGKLLRRDLIGQGTAPGWVVVGTFGPNLRSSGDLVFAANGDLYVTLSSPNGSHDLLAKVSTTNGAATLISPDTPTSIPFGNVFGLAFSGGVLYGLTTTSNGGSLIQINVTTGTATLVRPLTFSAAGAASYRSQ